MMNVPGLVDAADQHEPDRLAATRLAAAIVPLLGGLGISLVYWPGLVTYDSVRQYDQALSGQFDDWHPPMMEWIWRGFTHVAAGPALMLLLQLGLYGAGMIGLAVWAIRRGRPGLAVALGATTVLPLPAALMGEVLKDCLMAGALTAATGLALLGLNGRHPALRIIAAVLVVLAATLRFNAFLATIPLLVVLAGPRWWASWWRLALIVVAGGTVSLGAMPLANRALGAAHSDVELSLVIFDLAGITVHTGHDVFPPVPGTANSPTVISRCYSPVKWDTFAWWVDPLCPVSFDQIRPVFHQRGISPYGYLAGQILTHPVAYAEHRLAHYNLATRFLVRDQVDRPLQRRSAPNDWGFAVSNGRAVDRVDRVAMAAGQGPLGWPCCYMALALGLLLASGSLPSRIAIRMLAGSALLYAAGYAVFSVACELRYYLWTMIATAIALAITGSDLVVSPDQRNWRTGLLAFGPLAIITTIAVAWRI